MSLPFKCRACGSPQRLSKHIVTERQFGTGEKFLYGECAHCGSLSIATVPTDLDRHYPSDYYAYQTPDVHAAAPSFHQRFVHWLSGGDVVKRCIEQLLRLARITTSSQILDVGCGSGTWLQQLQQAGYQNLAGLEPYLPTAEHTSKGVTIRRGGIHTAEGEHDLITYHHVLEHIGDPRMEITAAAKRLKPGGYLLIRVPVADSWARRKFQTCWAQWDTPRHLWVPTRTALSLLAQENKLTEITCIDDSSGFQVWASRRYRANLTGLGGKYTPHNRKRYLYAALPSILAAVAWAAWLNNRQQGDQVAVLWQKPLAEKTAP